MHFDTNERRLDAFVSNKNIKWIHYMYKRRGRAASRGREYSTCHDKKRNKTTAKHEGQDFVSM